KVPGGYLADATTGPSLATLVTPVDVILPPDANNQAVLQIRIMTTNAVGNDEWVGIDDIVVSSNPSGGDATPPTLIATAPPDEAVNVSAATDIVLTFNENVQPGAGDIVISNGAGDPRTITVGGVDDPDATVTASGTTVTINPSLDLAADSTYHLTIASGAIQD